MNEKNIEEWIKSRKKLREIRSSHHLFEAIRRGDHTALSGAITLLESTREDDQMVARELLQMCLPFSGNSIRIGITGVPGVGKSSFIEKFGKTILEERQKVAVLAIDPSSERTGGSILGDKTRMELLSQDERAFIRPSAAGNTLGGVARKTRETIILCEAAGFDVILIETVGVGQSEIVVHSMVDFFLLLVLTGAGDELQGIKRGIMEMADGLAVTKADGDNFNRAIVVARQLKNAIHYFPPASNGWIPEVITCSSLENKNLDEIWEMISRYERHTKANNTFYSRRKKQDLNWFHETVKELLVHDLWSKENMEKYRIDLENKVKSGEITAFLAAEKIIAYYNQK